MPKNTLLVVIALAILAALVFGVNIGRKINTLENPQVIGEVSPKPNNDSPSPKPNLQKTNYVSRSCGVKFNISSDMTPIQASDGNTIFINKSDPNQSTVLICQKTIPTPPGQRLDETVPIGSVSANLYEESSASGKTVSGYHMLFRHPGKQIDVLISGMGESFREIIDSVSIY